MSDGKAVAERIAAEGIRIVDIRFTDLLGRWRHTSLAASRVDHRLLAEGLMVDGSGLPGWRDPNEPDLLVLPDPASAYADPFAAQPTLVLIGSVAEPGTGIGYQRDPRSIAAAAEGWLQNQSFADRLAVSVEIDCSLFDEPRGAPAAAAPWLERGGVDRGPSGAGWPRPTPWSDRLAAPTTDRHADIRSEITAILDTLGFAELRHEQGGAAEQARFAFAVDGLVAAGDRLQMFKDVVHHVAASYGKRATFMPKPQAHLPGNALSLQQRLWQGQRPVFAGQGYADLSPMCLSFIAGILRHARSLNAIMNPSTNSYRRLRLGEEEPVLLAYAAYNRSAAVRIPFAAVPEEKAVELRFPDPLANPYLALSAMLLAGVDGVLQKLEPGDAMDRNLYDLPPFEAGELEQVCSSLPEALAELARDQDYLTRQGLVSDEFLNAFAEVKRSEIDRVRQVPHPVEYELYFGP